MGIMNKENQGGYYIAVNDDDELPTPLMSARGNNNPYLNLSSYPQQNIQVQQNNPFLIQQTAHQFPQNQYVNIGNLNSNQKHSFDDSIKIKRKKNVNKKPTMKLEENIPVYYQTKKVIYP